MPRVMKRPSAKQLVVAAVRKNTLADNGAAATKADCSANTRPSSGMVQKKPACAVATSLYNALAPPKQQSWLTATSDDVNVVPSKFAVAVADRWQFKGILTKDITPWHIQSLFDEAEDDFLHAHHMLDVDSGRTHHILKYMSDKVQSAFGSACDWMAELRFIYTSC